MAAGTYVLALDGGQSSTGVWLLSTDIAHGLYRCVRGFHYSTEAGHSPERETQAEAIIAAIEALMAEAACLPGSVHAIGTSFMGATPGLAAYLETTFVHAPICRLSDADAAYAGTLWKAPGVCVTAGTGSVAMARNGQQSAVVGGWGYLFGDLGGGWSITQRAIQAAVAAIDQWGPPTRLVDELLSFFGESRPWSPGAQPGWPQLTAKKQGGHAQDTGQSVLPRESSYRALVSSVYGGKRLRAEVARTAPLVLALAEQGDGVAREIALVSASELAGYVRLGATRVGLGSAVSLGYAGGVLRGSAYLRGLVQEDLARAGISVVRRVLGSALAGAALYGLEAVGITITDSLRGAVAQAASHLK